MENEKRKLMAKIPLKHCVCVVIKTGTDCFLWQDLGFDKVHVVIIYWSEEPLDDGEGG